MEGLNTSDLATGGNWLMLSTLLYFMMNGAGIFETVVIVPKWTRSPPESLALFKGPYALDFKGFWIGMHSLHEVAFILAIVYCWQLPLIRNGLLTLFGLHFLVRVWTLAYFAPAIMRFQALAISGIPAADLKRRATLWKNLNYIRTGLFILLSLAQVPLLLAVLRISVQIKG
jgi:hypothetical protein